MEKHYDLIAIGAGSGGLSVAERAARHGARCAIIEPARLGGTCVNLGCVPKKVMWFGANIAHALHDAADYGFRVEPGPLDWSVLKAKRDAYVQGINDWYVTFLADSSIDRIAGAPVSSDRTRSRSAGDRYTADHIVIATGSRPFVPNVPGAELGITSEGFFDLDRCPGRVAIVGGGYIAVELAGVFNATGCEVTLLLRTHEDFLPGFDCMLRDTLMESIVSDGISIHANTSLASVARGADGQARPRHHDRRVDRGLRHARLGGRPSAEYGPARPPRRRGCPATRRGYVAVDDFQNTNVPGVYAIGDVTGRVPLTPVAVAAGRRLGDRLFGGEPDRRLSYENIASVDLQPPADGHRGPHRGGRAGEAR